VYKEYAALKGKGKVVPVL